MASSLVNRDTGTPIVWTKYWSGAVGANTQVSDTVSGLSARIIVVGTLGSLVVENSMGTTITYTAADILAQQYMLRGQFSRIVAAGSTAFDLQIGI